MPSPRTCLNTHTIIISVDALYARARVTAMEELRNIANRRLRGRDFHKDYGVMITDSSVVRADGSRNRGARRKR